MPGGRPSTYNEETADQICNELACSDRGLVAICAGDHMPAERTVYQWLAAHEEFAQKYARAKEMQGEFLAAQILSISDDGSADMVTRYREDGTEYQVVDQEHIQRSRLRVDSRKWLASKLAPKKYGDRLELAGSVDTSKGWADILRERRAKRAKETPDSRSTDL